MCITVPPPGISFLASPLALGGRLVPSGWQGRCLTTLIGAPPGKPFLRSPGRSGLGISHGPDARLMPTWAAEKEQLCSGPVKSRGQTPDQLQWRLRLAVRTAQTGVSAVWKSALSVPRCRLAYDLERILR